MTCDFEKSKVMIFRQKKKKKRKKNVGLMTNCRLGMVNETYEIEKDKKKVLLIMI